VSPERVADGADTLERASRFGHHFDAITPAGADVGAAAPMQRAIAPIQRMPVEEREGASEAASEAPAVDAPTAGGGMAVASEAPGAGEGGHDEAPSASSAPAQELAPLPGAAAESPDQVGGGSEGPVTSSAGDAQPIVSPLPAPEGVARERTGGTLREPKPKKRTEADRRREREQDLRAKARERVTADVMKAHAAKGGPKFPVEKLSIEEQKKLGRKDLAEYKLWQRAIRDAENGEYRRLGGKKVRGGTFRAPLVDQRTWLKEDGSDRAAYGL
jgi:hypothetical protein